jgi:hypothetical protein
VQSEIRSKYAFSFCSSTQRRMRSGHVHFGRTATWKTQDWCESTRSVWAGSAHKTENGGGGGGQPVQGGKGQGCARNSEFPSYCARKLAGLALRPGECRSSHSISAIHPLLDHRFPLLVNLFVIIGLAFLFFSHRRSSSLSLSFASYARLSYGQRPPRNKQGTVLKRKKPSL